MTENNDAAGAVENKAEEPTKDNIDFIKMMLSLSDRKKAEDMRRLKRGTYEGMTAFIAMMVMMCLLYGFLIPYMCDGLLDISRVWGWIVYVPASIYLYYKMRP
jgi:hypothetical protein